MILLLTNTTSTIGQNDRNRGSTAAEELAESPETQLPKQHRSIELLPWCHPDAPLTAKRSLPSSVDKKIPYDDVQNIFCEWFTSLIWRCMASMFDMFDTSRSSQKTATEVHLHRQKTQKAWKLDWNKTEALDLCVHKWDTQWTAKRGICHHLSSFLLNRTQSINVRISFCRCHLHGKHDEYWQSTKNDRTGSNPVEEVVNGLETELEFLRQGRSKGHI